MPHLPESCHLNFEQCFQFIESLPPVAQRTQGYLGHNERVRYDLALAETLLHPRIAPAQIVNPDRCVRQDHNWSVFTRLISSKVGSVPPAAASRVEALR